MKYILMFMDPCFQGSEVTHGVCKYGDQGSFEVPATVLAISLLQLYFGSGVQQSSSRFTHLQLDQIISATLSMEGAITRKIGDGGGDDGYTAPTPTLL